MSCAWGMGNLLNAMALYHSGIMIGGVGQAIFHRLYHIGMSLARTGPKVNHFFLRGYRWAGFFISNSCPCIILDQVQFIPSIGRVAPMGAKGGH